MCVHVYVCTHARAKKGPSSVLFHANLENRKLKRPESTRIVINVQNWFERHLFCAILNPKTQNRFWSFPLKKPVDVGSVCYKKPTLRVSLNSDGVAILKNTRPSILINMYDQITCNRCKITSASKDFIKCRKCRDMLHVVCPKRRPSELEQSDGFCQGCRQPSGSQVNMSCEFMMNEAITIMMAIDRILDTIQ